MTAPQISMPKKLPLQPRHLIWSCALLKRIAHAHLCSNRFSTCLDFNCIHNWRLCNYSFVFVLIILTSLVSTDKIQSYLSFKVRMINIKKKRNNFLDAIYEYSLYKPMQRSRPRDDFFKTPRNKTRRGRENT